MEDLIRRSDTIQAIDELLNSSYARQEPFGFAVRDALKLVRDMVNGDVPKSLSIPAVDAVEVRHGEWIEHEIFPAKGNVDMLQSARCPKCWRYHTTPYSYNFTNYSYCPNCGAKMDGEDGDA